jgi:hypothetical protein
MTGANKSQTWKTLPKSRQQEAKDAAYALLDELEVGDKPILSSIMKAKRVARLLSDEDAQRWLDLEATGYPQSFNISSLGSCRRYGLSSGRFTTDGKYYVSSAPQYEAQVRSSELKLRNMQFPTSLSPSISSANTNEFTGMQLGNAMKGVVQNFNTTVKGLSIIYHHEVKMISGLRSGLHNYAADCYHSLAFGDVAEGLFVEARRSVDNYVREIAPKAAEQLVSAFDRFDAGGAEALSHALTSCRRLLQTVADALYPPSDTPAIDKSGKERKVGAEQYKNRLLMHIETSISSKTSADILSSEMTHIATRLDSFYEKACKGVHADVTEDEVRLVLVSTYVFLGEILTNSSPQTTPVAPAAVATGLDKPVEMETLDDELSEKPEDEAAAKGPDQSEPGS